MNNGSEVMMEKQHPRGRPDSCRMFVLFTLLIHILGGISACSSFSQLPVMGTVSDGVYTQPQGNFSCPLRAESLGLNGAPEITDAFRTTRTEAVPLSERMPGDARNNRIVSDEILPSRAVRFKDASGTVIDISSGIRSHSVAMTLADGMNRGASWLFSKRDIALSSGRMMSGLMLVPWHEENMTYMGLNIADAYREGQGGGDAQLWIRSNLVMDSNVVHSINIQMPAASRLSKTINPRDLPAVRDYLIANPQIQKELLDQSSAFLERCHFSGEIK